MENLKEMSIHSTTSLTASENGEHTYAFTKDFEELNGKRGVLILLYPTRTEENYHVEDSTTIHIMKHMKQLGLKSYTIVNLFSHVVRKRLSTRGLTEYSCAVKPHVRSDGNRQSGTRKPLSASLLA